jgi:senataxin
MQFSDKQISNCQDVWNVNRAQGEAIKSALDNDGFSLIQGPPGSGKTKTIVAIVGGLLSTVLTSTTSGVKVAVPGSRGAQRNGTDAPSKKLLVCAPSNAAVDELVIRLKEGVKTTDGRHHRLNVVRIGRSEAINAQVLDVTMDELVTKRLGVNENDQKTREKNAELFKQHEKVSAQLRALHAQRDSDELGGVELTNLESQIATLHKGKNALSVRIDNAKDAERNAGRQAELSRKRAQQAVLDEAHVICATLSGSGHDMFQSLNIEFETVIIDEAAQCVEMSSLIPLKYGCVKCIMVGDPKQLPPTVFSKEAAKFQYEQSLFVRMQNNYENEVHLLDTQYRMHPNISIFPSQTFYDGLLMDGKGMAALRKRPWHASAVLAPYRFFDVAGQHQSAPRGHSLINVAEIDIAIALFDRLKTDFPTYDYKSNIGIITPYKSQLNALKERFSARYGPLILEDVDFNTTDAFQGRESEIIIFSCVRASQAGGIGFLQDIRRMNVGLTRAKCSLWVLGNSESLVRGHFWRKLVEDARARDLYSTGNLREVLGKPSSAYPATDNTDRSMLDVSSHIWQMNGNKNGSASTHDAGPKQNEKDLSKPPLDSERMDGVTYRFEDRYAKKTKATSEIGNNGDRVLPQQELSGGPQDVEMSDADASASGNATPNDIISRAETPVSGAEQSVNQTNGAVKPRPAQPPRKRPAANPFMPRKQPRPKAP